MKTSSNILLVDSYDSFSFNLVALVADVTGANVITVHNDGPSVEDLKKVLPQIDAVVLGPGPGSPYNPPDVGLLPDLWGMEGELLVPVFGVCLGFQSMVLAFSGEVTRLTTVQHGQPGRIEHTGTGLFDGIQYPFEAIRYHSLQGIMLDTKSDLVALASTVDGDETIMMAAHHSSKPFYGVQYHPESICSERGADVVGNFWKLAQSYNKEFRTVKQDVAAITAFEEQFSIKPPPFERVFDSGGQGQISFQSVRLSNVSSYSQFVVQICDFIKSLGYEFTLLNSGSEPGRWSIIGLLEPGVTTMIMHYLSYEPQHVFTRKYKSDHEQKTKLCDQGVYEFLANYMMPKLQKFKGSECPPDAKFVGGLVGYLSYEMNGIPNQVEQSDRTYADVSMVDIEKSILVDQQTGVLYVVSLQDPELPKSLSAKLETFLKDVPEPDHVPQSCQEYFEQKTEFKFPDRDEYISNIEECKEFLRSGDSYELCLTAQTEITLPDQLDPWKLYKILLNRNPSPYSCFLDLFDSTLVGSSPERFMSWNRNGVCEFRPIKGTVKKSLGMSYEKANAILNTNKERGENLMIVDLIRHDLNQIVSNVRVDKLMTVEEYHTVYQLVSVIQGDLPKNYLGIDLLARSLPPGSMTGAPKKRSVEILRDLESHSRRGIYSGVCGFWSVTDEADWSVVIRSAFQYKNESTKLWRIGAGGAITILSEPAAEWDEMQTKLESALQAFV